MYDIVAETPDFFDGLYFVSMDLFLLFPKATICFRQTFSQNSTIPR
jgi:hypothetical protein